LEPPEKPGRFSGQLPLVVASLRHKIGHHQQAACGHGCLRVVALLEPIARLHDARLIIGQVDLVAVLDGCGRCCGWATAGLFARAPLLLGARSQLGLMFDLLLRQALLGPSFDLRLRLGNSLQAQLPALQFFRDRHPVRDVRRRRHFG